MIEEGIRRICLLCCATLRRWCRRRVLTVPRPDAGLPRGQSLGEALTLYTALKSVCSASPGTAPSTTHPPPPPLSLMPRSLLPRRHPCRNVAPYQRQQRLAKPRAELNPEGGPLRHKERSSPKAEEHHRDRNALLPAHAQPTFLLGMPQTSTGVARLGRRYRTA